MYCFLSRTFIFVLAAISSEAFLHSSRLPWLMFSVVCAHEWFWVDDSDGLRGILPFPPISRHLTVHSWLPRTIFAALDHLSFSPSVVTGNFPQCEISQTRAAAPPLGGREARWRRRVQCGPPAGKGRRGRRLRRRRASLSQPHASPDSAAARTRGLGVVVGAGGGLRCRGLTPSGPGSPPVGSSPRCAATAHGYSRPGGPGKWYPGRERGPGGLGMRGRGFRPHRSGAGGPGPVPRAAGVQAGFRSGPGDLLGFP